MSHKINDISREIHPAKQQKATKKIGNDGKQQKEKAILSVTTFLQTKVP